MKKSKRQPRGTTTNPTALEQGEALVESQRVPMIVAATSSRGNKHITEQTTAVPLNELVLCDEAANPNKMTDEEMKHLKAAIDNSGFNQPILVNQLDYNAEQRMQYEVIDGNHRVMVARELGYTSLPAVVRRYTPEQVRAIRLGMNRNRGQVDLGIAQSILADLASEGWDLTELGNLTGFATEEVIDLTTPKDEGPALADPGALTLPDDANVASKPFVLEISFTNRKDYQLARRKLKKAAGETGDLGLGLLHVLGEAEEEQPS